MIYTAIDFETADNGKDSACAVGLVKMQDTCIIDSFYRLIRPPRSWIKYAYFHGITWDMLKNQPNFAEQWHDIEAFLKGTEAFIAHNAQFDKGVLYGKRLCYPSPGNSFLLYAQRFQKIFAAAEKQFGLRLQRLANKSAASPCTFRRRGMR